MAKTTRSRPAAATRGKTGPPSLPRRERDKAETRRLILDAARTMFAREGYEATTMRGIADRIGYTATAIYHHFTDKHALMLELCATDFRALGSALRSIGRIADPVERIRQMGRAYVRFAEEHPEQFRFMFLTPRPAPTAEDMELLNAADDGYEFLRQSVGEAMEAGRLRPEFDDADLVAQLLWAGVHGLATIHLHMTHAAPPGFPIQPAHAVIDSFCDAIMNGLLRKG